MNYYYSIVSIEFLINVEDTINFEIEGEIIGQASMSAAHHKHSTVLFLLQTNLS